jgi:hypothetical protein
MRPRLRALWEEHPLAVVLAVAAALRLAAAIWSRGYGMLDDHFDVIEVAQRWADGHRDWLGRPDSYRSLLYPGLHAAIFRALEGMGVFDPQSKMLVVRLLHGAWSMLTVLFGYRAAEALAGRRAARVAGMLLAAFWFLPFFSVRNLIESVSQPPLILAVWLLARPDAERRPRQALAAGAWLVLAFAIRFPTAIASAGIVLFLLASRRVRDGLLVAAGALASALVLQGGSDWLGYGRPFSSVLAYVAFNSNPATVSTFPTGPWHRYLGLLLGILIPPTSLALLWGGLRAWRRLGLLFWPTAAFLVAHSAFAGKQERFLLPVIPLLLLLCSLGWLADEEELPFWRRHVRLARGLWTWFWIANTVLLALYTLNYGKRPQVEAMTWLRGRPDLSSLVVEWSERPQILPTFYLGRVVPIEVLGPGDDVRALVERRASPGSARANYLLLMGDAGIDARLARLGDVAAGAVLVHRVTPGPVDWLLHRMNPRHNVNLTARVYRLP